jgi:hypothetical protein
MENAVINFYFVLLLRKLVWLLGNMSRRLRRGKDNSAAFQILEA